nr:MAG TPA: hypothetical protein [Caudoviricetes sp.]
MLGMTNSNNLLNQEAHNIHLVKCFSPAHLDTSDPLIYHYHVSNLSY